jgi:arsenate reductase-like glutaredoxin family protein
MNNTEKVLYKMNELAFDNIVRIYKTELSKEVGINAGDLNGCLNNLIKEEKIVLKEKAKNMGRGKWSPYVFEVNNKSNAVSVSIQPIETESIIENYSGIQVRLLNNNGKWVIPLNDVCDGIGLDRVATRQLIDRNIELFIDYIGSCVIQSPSGKQETMVLTRDGIVGLLMKISYNRLPKDKQEKVIDFQKWAISKLTELISNGKVELIDQEHAQVQQDIGYITGMNEEQIDKVFNDIDEQFSKLINTAKSTIKKMKNQNDKVTYEKEILKKENQKWINNTLALKEKLLSANIL